MSDEHRGADDVTMPGGAGPTRSVTPFVPRTPTPGAGRFTPGAIIAGRYRLVALLGKGGMGEVYRADDLTLDQPVALKFLPDGVAADAAHLAQFHNELRTARQVSHKNVVRLYDLRLRRASFLDDGIRGRGGSRLPAPPDRPDP